jgi:hypothetical protein
MLRSNVGPDDELRIARMRRKTAHRQPKELDHRELDLSFAAAFAVLLAVSLFFLQRAFPADRMLSPVMSLELFSAPPSNE